MEQQPILHSSSNSKETRIRQLKIQIQILEEQLKAAKRDLWKLEHSN